jgi:hypothetical protein
MLVYRLSIVGLLAICAVLLVMLANRPRDTTLAPREDRVTVIDATCYSCGSGVGPSDWDLAGDVDLTPDEAVVAIDGVPMHGTAIDAFALKDRLRYHGERFQLVIESPRGQRRVDLVLH